MMSSLARIVSDVCILAEQLTTYIVGLEQCFSTELGEGYFTRWGTAKGQCLETFEGRGGLTDHRRRAATDI